ncbi:glycosyltransferase family 2 protein [Microbacterium deminutum]
MTLMVRDEADIIAAMIEHHLAQGVDLIIATDNASIDGTRDILAAYASTGRVELHDYLEHDKNQSAVVSAMASRAAAVHHADWVLNADADEFFVAKDRTLSLKDAFRGIPKHLGSFSAPVTNMTGRPARSGAALGRLVWRDIRDEESLMSSVALHAHPSANAIHVGRPGVTVQQGNHGVDIPSQGQPEDRFAIEVLHVPWRSYAQYSTKVINTGRAYDANPLLNPSPRHHGMRDYRFWRAGVLEPIYIVRHPAGEPEAGFSYDSRIVDGLLSVVGRGEALRPQFLTAVLDDTDEGYTDEEVARAAEVSAIVIPLEVEHIAASTRWRDLYRGEAAERKRVEATLDRVTQQRDALASRPEARLRRLGGRLLRRFTSRESERKP